MGNGPICCLWFQLSMGHCFTLLTHSVYIKQGCKWWWEPESLTKGAPVGRAMTDPFSRYFSLGHRSLVLASIPPFPSKKLRHNHKRVCHLFPLFVATVKKCCVKSPTGHQSVLGAGGTLRPTVGELLGKCLFVLSLFLHLKNGVMVFTSFIR